MAPADMRKEGSAYDLTLALGILVASHQIKAEAIGDYLIMGEMSLDGGLQPIKGALPIAIKAKEEGFIRVEESEKLLQQLASTSAVVWSPQTDKKSIEALSELLKTVEDEDT